MISRRKHLFSGFDRLSGNRVDQCRREGLYILTHFCTEGHHQFPLALLDGGQDQVDAFFNGHDFRFVHRAVHHRLAVRPKGAFTYLGGHEVGVDHGHAHAIIRQVLGGLLAKLTPTMNFCEVEGDAVFVYGSAKRLSRGELIAELIESTYASFRDQQRTMIRNATCPCDACRAIGRLDLKFVVHYGEFVLQEIAGKTGPVGSSVNLVHALLKNQVSEQTGWRGYVLYTAEALAQMSLPSDGMHRDLVHHEHLGTSVTYSMDLNVRYQALCERRRIFIDEGDAHIEVVRDLYVARPVVWDWLNDTDKRTRWTMHTAWAAVTRPGGRTGPNASNHCATFNAIEYILDWRPFDYYTVRITRRGLDVSTLRPWRRW